MKLRTRLFLWIGFLFLLFAVISYGLESFLVHRNLKKSKQELREDIQKNEEQKRQHFQGFLEDVMADFQAKVEALLYRINANDSFKKKLFQQSWYFSSILLLENQWIGCIQNTDQNQRSSLIIPSAKALKPFQKKEINEDLAWIYFTDDPSNKVYMGIRIRSEEIKAYFPSMESFGLFKLSDHYCFYDPKLLQELEFTKEFVHKSSLFTQEEVDQLNDYQKVFFERLQRAKAYVKEHSYKASLFEKEKKVLSDHSSSEFHKSLDQNIAQIEVVQQIWTLNSLFLLNLFGKSPIDQKAPMGIVSSQAHKGLFTDFVLFDAKMFDDQKKLQTSTSLALMKAPFQNQFFLGSTLNDSNRNYLSVGIDLSNMLERLSIATNQYVLLTEKGKVLSVYSPQGTHLASSFFYRAKMSDLTQDKGVITLNGKTYYYLRLSPNQNKDLHLYVLDLETKAFSFVSSIAHKISSLIHNISFSMRIIAVIGLFIVLILLHNITKKVSHPISQLAKMTEPIAQGKFEQVEIPKTPLGPSKEIHTLCESFSQMVTSLKDKEKVRGVLNKVVSKEIAEEILKGSIHLGGEEKIVTILFADIRNFTRITEKMPPQEVIQLLNLAMTKISQVIDEYKGVIDKFVGDEVMALFGAPIHDDQAVMRALVAAKAIIKALDQFNETRKKENKEEIHVGIGIHTGMVVAGNMGAENRLNYTVLGSNVNLASRMCETAKENEILITKNTFEAAQKKTIKVNELDPVTLKGFSEKIPVYRLEEVFFDFSPKRKDA